MRKKRVLFVEKTAGMLNLWEKQFENTPAVIFKAKNLGEFVSHFRIQLGNFDLIVIGNAEFEIDRKVEDTIVDIRRLRYEGYILICTTIAEAQEKQLCAGGPNTISVKKRSAANVVKALLELEVS